VERGALEQSDGKKVCMALAPGKSLADRKSVFRKRRRVKRAAVRLTLK
jgi:hypothetical protein